MRKRAIGVVLVLGIGLPACGGGHESMDMSSHAEESAPVVPGARVVDVTGDAYTFAPDRIEVPAATDFTIALRSTDIPHDVTVEGVGHVVHAKGGKSARGGLNIARAGTYTFYCSVKGHRSEGMTGEIVVS